VPEKLEEKACETLSSAGRSYASCNAGLSWTHLANRQSFYRHRIIPQQLVDTNDRDTSTTLFGHKCSAPIGFAPIGINKIYHPKGELPVAKVAGELRLPYGLSTAGSTAIEDVAASNDEGAKLPLAVKVEGADDEPIRFFQLYMPHDDELTVSLLTRAHQNGFTACILTTDTWQLGWRHDDVDAGNYAFYRGIGADMGLTDPVFQKRMAAAGIDPKKQPEEAGAMWIDNVWHGRAWSWEKIPWLIKTWKKISGGRPFLLKGIQSVGDAQKAVEVGCDGIVVSNHAGRQVDGAIASLGALENIINAGIGEKIVVTFDSGIRGGSDVIKALCIGAKFVWVGRLWIWGLSIMGEQGVRHVMKSLLAEFDISMAVGGFKNIGEMTRDRLGKCTARKPAYERPAADFKCRVLPKGIQLDRREIEALIAKANFYATLCRFKHCTKYSWI
jgi:isopentenyl diphosphate isomerase/L-lactate dehydrogenase-like FMN-dependent dehydrogenase